MRRTLLFCFLGFSGPILIIKIKIKILMGWGLILGVCVLGLLILKWVVRSVNCWYYERKLGERRYELPPGDFGWPFIGNMWSFLRAFKSTSPDSFISSFLHRSSPSSSSSLSPLSLLKFQLKLHFCMFVMISFPHVCMWLVLSWNHH